MLIENKSKWLFLGTFAALVCLQIYSAFHHQLFGDEAFYWLESQHLAWSYAELPGWTQWAVSLSQWLLPQHELTVRLPGLMAAWSLPWLGMLINQKLTESKSFNPWETGLLVMALPLLSVVGILAVPDIWLLFFGLLSVLLLIQCTHSHGHIDFILLGVILACGINVHVRFWIIVFLACWVVLWRFRNHQKVIKKLIYFSLPIMLIGFIPIILFNLQNDFSLLTFQLSERHPWAFQASHFNFFPIQLLVASPLVFWLCAKVIIQMQSLNQMQKTLAYIALGHWIIYAALGFFTDNMRFNVHWTLFSYVLLLVVASSVPTDKKLKSWSVLTGVISSFALITALFYALHLANPVTKLNAQFTENFRGWQQMAIKTTSLLQSTPSTFIVTDHFMTLAALKFYSKEPTKFTSLTHPSNTKHGREQQLAIMGYHQSATSEKGLLITEHSGMKLEQMIPFYLSACEKLKGIQMIDHLDVSDGIKSYYYFKTGTGVCSLPPIIYLETSEQHLTGWVLLPKSQTAKVSVMQDDTKTVLNPTKQTLGTNQLFEPLSDKDYSLHLFKTNDVQTGPFQITIEYLGLNIKSTKFYLN
ncbi:ArnT family glycosyltransferase [Marinicella litoralis]|uniref:Dolichyl-phosphate-mannose-protein mannosyltransferase n=1 Tax=Marinicella litoralis TaxID=644220 RepID=A0A4R6XYD6_9GAMM|nr:glycosyltransferase family 39 protein [Marinicella litoralis]TDR23237.1 dolichyl-phosphate-mannose-protein mannosyltransferase [Marinicella litoralis]